MEETTREENERSVAAPIIFTIVIAFQFLSTYIQHKTKRGSMSNVETQLHEEIKQLHKEASSLSQTSTFAQAT